MLYKNDITQSRLSVFADDTKMYSIIRSIFNASRETSKTCRILSSQS